MNASLRCLMCCLALFCADVLAESLYCPFKYCEDFDCENEKICGPAVFLRDDHDLCQCCSSCYRIIGENDTCSLADQSNVRPIRDMCEPGTKCQKKNGIGMCTKTSEGN